MKRPLLIIAGLIAAFGIGFYTNSFIEKSPEQKKEIHQKKEQATLKKTDTMKLGAFSVSLNVKDIKASKQFYENLGFTVLAGSLEQNYLILKNGLSIIGIFQGMFENNILTFNPGWDENGKNTDPFDDVREIQRQLKSKGVKIDTEADEKSSGPASIMLTDPDGNVILFDQHR